MQMQLLDRLDKRTKMALLDKIPELIHQDYYHPAVFDLTENVGGQHALVALNPNA